MELKQLAKHIRIDALKSMSSVGSGHVGGCMSVAEVLAVLYGKLMKVDPANPKMEGRDRLVVSKGHVGPAVYAALGNVGFFDKQELLTTLNKGGTRFPSHCNASKVPGVDFSTGSLGQGLSAAAGMALASKLKGDGATIYAIVGDGELQEGQIWEAAMFAAQQKLSNLIAFVDKNGAQIDGTTDDVCSVGDVESKWKDFNWATVSCDGHDTDAILAAVEEVKKDKERPKMIVLNTVKGKGISFAEAGKHKCHSMTVDSDMLARALKEIDV